MPASTANPKLAKQTAPASLLMPSCSLSEIRMADSSGAVARRFWMALPFLLVPVLLALVLLKERLNRRQAAGLTCAAFAIGLIALQ